MLSAASDHRYGQALLDSVQNGSYPESEEIISAELPSSQIPAILKLLSLARNEVKASIQGISKDSAPDIDGWILQARQLSHDVELVRDTSSHITRGASDLGKLTGQARDAASKVALLQGEVAFTEKLLSVFERMRKLQQVLSSIQTAIAEDRTIDICSVLVEAEIELEDVRTRYNTRAIGILKAKLTNIRVEVEENVVHAWNKLLHIGASSSTLRVQRDIQSKSAVTLDAIVDALGNLGLLEDAVATFSRSLENIILAPRLRSHPDGSVTSISSDGDELRVLGMSSESTPQQLFDGISELIIFLEKHLPKAVLLRLSELLMPHLTFQILSVWLPSMMPTGLEATKALQDTAKSVLQFGIFLEEHQWPGNAALSGWVRNVPTFWLTKRREASLQRVRSLLAGGPKGVKRVERVETQFLSPKEDVFANGGTRDDWNAEWSDEERSTLQIPAYIGTEPSNDAQEEDVAAWGLDEANSGSEVQSLMAEQPANEENDVWGWGEEGEEEEEGEGISQSAKRDFPSPPWREGNGYAKPPPQTEREVTLRETYSITALPKEILEIIAQEIMDAESLVKAEYSASPIASAATGLLDFPDLVLTMYRASAPFSYSSDPSGNMFIYNDGLWLTERLQELSQKHVTTPLRLSVDRETLSAFGKRAYGKEMESQRTVLSDLLDGAQGFTRCTEPPFAQACDLAINSAVERLRELHTQWAPILSYSALLQSLGSLLSTLINKLVVDVEDMSDISEPESQRLTSFCNRVASLEDLFMPQAQTRVQVQEQGEVVMPLTAVYTPGWLRFQYLANILESSLVDIKFLWVDGELSLEFDVEELIDLIKALFADSEHRRRAIAEMRRALGSR